MFLIKPHRREKNGVVYEYWTLEESVRTIGTESGERKERIAREFFAVVDALPSEIRRRDALHLLAARLGLPESAVQLDHQRPHPGLVVDPEVDEWPVLAPLTVGSVLLRCDGTVSYSRNRACIRNCVPNVS